LQWQNQGLVFAFCKFECLFLALEFSQGGSMMTSNSRRKWCGQRINEGQLSVGVSVCDAVDVFNVFGVAR
jgi:hypothetical protein